MATASHTKKGSRRTSSHDHGRRGDPRMNEAVKARENDPEMELLHALLAGGFVFPQLKYNSSEGFNSKEVLDTDGVTLWQRKNQLLRRLRRAKNRKSAGPKPPKNWKRKKEEQTSPQPKTQPEPQTQQQQQQPPPHQSPQQQVISQQPTSEQQAQQQQPAQVPPPQPQVQQQQMPRQSPPQMQPQQMPQHSPLWSQQQVSQNPTPQPQQQQPLPQDLQHQSTELGPPTFEYALQNQQQLSRWQDLIFWYLQMGVGTIHTWVWLNNWWAQQRIAPIVTEEDEAHEFQNLPPNDLSQAMADIVGSLSSSVSEELPVGQQVLTISLLRREIESLPLMEKVELLEAISRDGRFYDDTWLLRFLQADGFDVKAAAKRMTLYWCKRVTYLGRERAFLPFTIRNAFSEDLLYVLKMGYARVLPLPDLFGRTIIFMEPGRIMGKTFDDTVMLRSIFYTLHAHLDQPDNGKNGVVFLIDSKTAMPQHIDMSFLYELMHIFKCTLFRVKAFHFCNPKMFTLKIVFPFGKYFLNPYLRQRMFIHEETGEQLIEQLKLYGMPLERLPTELGGSILLDNDKWVDERLAEGL